MVRLLARLGGKRVVGDVLLSRFAPNELADSGDKVEPSIEDVHLTCSACDRLLRHTRYPSNAPRNLACTVGFAAEGRYV